MIVPGCPCICNEISELCGAMASPVRAHIQGVAPLLDSEPLCCRRSMSVETHRDTGTDARLQGIDNSTAAWDLLLAPRREQSDDPKYARNSVQAQVSSGQNTAACAAVLRRT